VTPQFWLATFGRKRPLENGVQGAPPLMMSPAGGERGMLALAVDIWRVGDDFAVFVSNADSLDAPRSLQCRICFSNSVQACDDLRDRGYPAIEARAEWDEEAGELKLFAPFFSDAERMEQPPSEAILALRDVKFAAPPDPKQEAVEIAYEQSRIAPDPDHPDTQLAARPATWLTSRSSARPRPLAGIPVIAHRARYPTLDPLPTSNASHSSASTVWSGALNLSVGGTDSLSELVRGLVSQDSVLKYPAIPGGIHLPRPIHIKPRSDAFFAPAFRFDDVEVLGFRVDLGEFGKVADELLTDLVAPLNFHLTEHRRTDSGYQHAMSDFRYRPASRTLMIELLRYGKMRLKRPTPPLSLEDYQSQHELLVRVLVGMVDDGTAQARNPATFVSAIFVDNPWSKFLGREAQGFDKRLAQFCAGRDQVPLGPDGRLLHARAHDAPQPLGTVTAVRLIDRLGQVARGTPPVLTLDCAPHRCQNWDEFDSVDMRLALVNSAFFGAQWRQSDFDAVEFRRSFARTVFSESLLGFRSVQTSPVDDRPLEKAWITGRFTIDNVSVVFPAGVATLIFQEIDSAPAAWNRLCRLMSGGGPAAEIDLPTGDWYRMKCTTDLHVDDGPVDIALAW
jgi:hypothetical protein